MLAGMNVASAPSSARRDAAYRRLVAFILRLDVASLNRELRAGQQEFRLPRAA
jgi:hypothetical protein